VIYTFGWVLSPTENRARKSGTVTGQTTGGIMQKLQNKFIGCYTTDTGASVRLRQYGGH